LHARDGIVHGSQSVGGGVHDQPQQIDQRRTATDTIGGQRALVALDQVLACPCA
jgi:hypothetical protein